MGLPVDLDDPLWQLTNGLQGYWPLGMATGAAAPDIWLGNSLTNNNSVARQPGVSLLTAPNFVFGSNQYGTVNSNSSLATNGGDFSVEVWARPADFTNIHMMLTKSAGGFANTEYELRTETTGKVSFITANTLATGFTAQSSSALTAGLWYQIIGTFKASTGAMTLYVNAVSAGTATLTGTLFSGTEPVMIGQRSDLNVTLPMNGPLQFARWWQGHCLSQAEVTAAFNNYNGLTYAGLVAAGVTAPTRSWDLVDASGNFADAAGSADTMTATNGPIARVAGIGGVGNSSGFVGANSSFLSLPGTNLQLGGNTYFTIAFLYNSSNVAATQYLISKDDGGTNREYDIVLNSGTSFRAFIFADGTGATAKTAISGASVSAGKWYFVCAWYDGTNLNISVNNANLGQVATTAGTFSGSSVFNLGAQNSSANFASGLMSGVGIWKRALSANDRAWLFAGGLGRFLGSW